VLVGPPAYDERQRVNVLTSGHSRTDFAWRLRQDRTQKSLGGATEVTNLAALRHIVDG